MNKLIPDRIVIQHLYDKYVVSKTDGTPTDPDAEYFVLRIDTDPHARSALAYYARCMMGHDVGFAEELRSWLREVELNDVEIAIREGKKLKEEDVTPSEYADITREEQDLFT